MKAALAALFFAITLARVLLKKSRRRRSAKTAATRSCRGLKSSRASFLRKIPRIGFRGELIGLDHVNRTGTLRPDRTNDQRTDDYDRPMPFTLLPYGTLRFHGAPAELRDIPIGTHLHGEWYFEPKVGKDNKGAFTKALRLEDDFSFHERQQRTWRIDAVQIDKGTLTVTGQTGADNQPDEKP